MADQKNTRRKRFVVLVNAGLFQLAVIGVYPTFKKATDAANLMGGFVEPLLKPEDGLKLFQRKDVPDATPIPESGNNL